MPSDSSARSEDRLFLRRYTSLPVLVDMLHHRRVTLVDPERWPDKNDTAFLEAYKEKRNLKTLVAICLTATSERFHHWNVFANGPAGVCIEFHRGAFLEAVGSIEGLRHGPVTYREIEQLDKTPPAIDELPFLKRFPYIDERDRKSVVWGNSVYMGGGRIN